MAYSVIIFLGFFFLFLLMIIVLVGYVKYKHQVSINPIILALLGIEVTLIGGLLLLKDFSDYAQGQFLELLSWILLTIGFIIVLYSLLKRFN